MCSLLAFARPVSLARQWKGNFGGREREKEDGKRGKGYWRPSRTAEEGERGGTSPFPLYVKKAAAKAEEEEERCSLHFRYYYVSCLDKCEGIAFPSKNTVCATFPLFLLP